MTDKMFRKAVLQLLIAIAKVIILREPIVSTRIQMVTAVGYAEQLLQDDEP